MAHFPAIKGPHVRVMPAVEFGWLRRSGLDSSREAAWELPNGNIYYCKQDKTPIILESVLSNGLRHWRVEEIDA